MYNRYSLFGVGGRRRAALQRLIWKKLKGRHGYGLLAFGQMANFLTLLFTGYEGIGFVMTNWFFGIWYGLGSIISLTGMRVIIKERNEINYRHSKWVLFAVFIWVIGFIFTIINIAIEPEPRVHTSDSTIMKFSIMIVVVTFFNMIVVLALVLNIFPPRWRLRVIVIFGVLLVGYMVNHAIAYPEVEHIYQEMADFADGETKTYTLLNYTYNKTPDEEEMVDKYDELTDSLSIHFYIDMFIIVTIWLTVGVCAFLFKRAKKGWGDKEEGEDEEMEDDYMEEDIFEVEDDALPGEVEYEETDGEEEKGDVLDRLYHK